LKEYR